MSTRQQNEKKFGNWESLPSGGRCYWYELTGRGGWKARYLKEVDDKEKNRAVLAGDLRCQWTIGGNSRKVSRG